jgi:GTP-binding protein
LGLDFLVLLTKADKLTKVEANKALSIARLQTGGGSLKLFSALKKQGVTEVAQLLHQWTHDANWTGNGTQHTASDHADSGSHNDMDTDVASDIDDHADRD